MVKMLAPIAHASHAAQGQQKGFIAALCSGNKIVYVELDLTSDPEQQSTQVITSKHCPLCSVVEQDISPSHVGTPSYVFQQAPYQFFQSNTFFGTYLTNSKAIRAPPVFA